VGRAILLDGVHSWLSLVRRPHLKVPPSKFYHAATYADRMTNDAAERAPRGIALGRKAWLFAGADCGGERAALIYTLIQTARLKPLTRRHGSPTSLHESTTTVLPILISFFHGNGRRAQSTLPPDTAQGNADSTISAALGEGIPFPEPNAATTSPVVATSSPESILLLSHMRFSGRGRGETEPSKRRKNRSV
jgi:hypothetical protein